MLNNLDAVHVWHIEVSHNQLVYLLELLVPQFYDLDCFVTVVSILELNLILLKDARQSVSAECVVFDDKNLLQRVINIYLIK